MAQFIPPKLLFTVVYEQLLKAFVSQKFIELEQCQPPEAHLRNHLTPTQDLIIGLMTNWSERESAYHREISRLHIYLEDLPSKLFVEFSNELWTFLATFKESHKKSFGDPSLPPTHAEWDSIRTLVAKRLDIPKEEAARSPLVSKMMSWWNSNASIEIIVPSGTGKSSTLYTDSRSSFMPYDNPITEMQNNDISQRIAAVRKNEKLSQIKAAKKWNISLGTLRDWEQGRSQPRGLYRERIEDILIKIERGHSS